MTLTKIRLVGAGLLTALALAGATVNSVASATGDTNTVSIDAAKDPTAAANAMKLFPTATDTSFTATGNPAYSNTDWTLASTNSINNPPGGDQNITQIVESTHVSSSSLSLGGSVEASTTLGLIGLADTKISVKFSAEHQWTAENSDSEEVRATAVPGKVVWVVASNREASFTGDYTFTANGTSYHVTNVTITQPAPVTGGDIGTETTYMAVERDYGSIYNVNAMAGRALPSGTVPISQTPQLARITAQLPKYVQIHEVYKHAH